MKKYYLYIIILLALVIAPNLVLAHGVGETLTIDKDGYEIDIDLDTKNPISNSAIRFDFDLTDSEEKGLSTDFDYIWVRIQKGQKTIFAGGIGKPEFGPMGFTTVLPEAGSYILSVRFQNVGEKVVEGETTLNISLGSGGESERSGFLGYLFTTQFLFGLITGLILVFLAKAILKKK